MSKYTKKQLNAISTYYSFRANENWRHDRYLLDDEEDIKVYRELNKKYKYVECKKRALRKYLREKYGDDQARKIK